MTNLVNLCRLRISKKVFCIIIIKLFNMKKLIQKDQTIYAFENGKLRELGNAVKMEPVSVGIYNIGHDVYLLDGNVLELVAAQAFACKIVRYEPAKSETVRDLSYKLLCHPKDYGEPSQKLLDVYQELISRKDEGCTLPDEAVCILSGAMHGGDITNLYIAKGEHKGFVNKSELIEVGLPSEHAFIYKGMVYAPDGHLNFRRCALEPLLKAKSYMIFWAGRHNTLLFALVQKDTKTELMRLGPVIETVVTSVGNLIVTEDDDDRYAIYRLGERLEKVVSFEGFGGNWDIDASTGDVYVMVGPRVKQRYVFSRGRYTLSDTD